MSKHSFLLPKSILAFIFLSLLAGCKKMDAIPLKKNIQTVLLSDTVSSKTFSKLKNQTSALPPNVSFTPFNIVCNISLRDENGEFVSANNYPGTAVAQPSNQSIMQGYYLYTESVSVTSLTCQLTPPFPTTRVTANWKYLVTVITTTTDRRTHRSTSQSDPYWDRSSTSMLAPQP